MLNLILLGFYGTGKSSTGNSILGKNVFPVSTSKKVDTLKSAIKESDTTFSIIDDFDVLVCGKNADFDNIAHNLQLSKEGITAFLFVLKYGERFGNEHKNVIDLTKKIFGNEVFRQFGICVLTSGDNYKKDNEPKKVKEWFQKQGGELEKLYNECNTRCVLFDNRKKGDKDKEGKKQVEKLQKMVDGIFKHNNRNYGMCDFEEAKPQRDSLRMDKKLNDKQEECRQFIAKMEKNVNEAVENGNKDNLQSVLRELKIYLDTFIRDFPTETKLKESIKNELDNAKCDVASKIKTLHLNSTTHDTIVSGASCKKRGAEKPTSAPYDSNNYSISATNSTRNLETINKTPNNTYNNESLKDNALENKIVETETLLKSLYYRYLSDPSKKLSKESEIVKKLSVFLECELRETSAETVI